MGRIWRWFVADLRGDHNKRRGGPTSFERYIPTPVLVVLIGAGAFVWLSNLFIHESRLVKALTEIAGLFVAFSALGILRQRRRWGRRSP